MIQKQLFDVFENVELKVKYQLYIYNYFKVIELK